MSDAALRHKVAVALHDLECGDRTCEPLVMGKFYRQADIALEFVRQFAIEKRATYPVFDRPGLIVQHALFADLLSAP